MHLRDYVDDLRQRLIEVRNGRDFRTLSYEIGISHVTVGQFLGKGDDLRLATLEKIEQWVEGQEHGVATSQPA